MPTVISIESLSKTYRLGQIGTGTFSRDLEVWWAKVRGRPNPLLRIGEKDYDNREGETLWALRDVSFTVQEGDVLGIIGRNGAGKSTLLKILSRVTAPSSGKVKLKGRVASLLEVGTGFHPDLTGRENIHLNGAILGMSRKEIERKFDEIVDFAEVEKFINTPVKRYSSGMYVRLAFAVAAHLEPEILVVDEVLAVGDAEFQKKCLGKMGAVAKEGRTVLFVSHQMDAISNLCPTTYVFDAGKIAYQGESSAAISFYLNSMRSLQEDEHILFGLSESQAGIYIERIEVLSVDDLTPKPMICTWDGLVLRVSYVSDRDIRAGTVILDIRDTNHKRLVVFDSGLKIPIRQGRHSVDCLIPKIPLAAGNYCLGAGLALSNNEWLWRETNLATFQIHGKDVFDIGRPPLLERMIFAVEHQWSVSSE